MKSKMAITTIISKKIIINAQNNAKGTHNGQNTHTQGRSM
jgi:hypothetical protein